MSYISLGYTLARKILANLDKASANGNGNVVYSPWGVFRMYKSNKRGRFYSISKSTVFHNGGSYKIGSLRIRLLGLGK
jgi:hypothetical protein